MAHNTKEETLIWLSVSAALHTAIIVAIFASLVTQPLLVISQGPKKQTPQPLVASEQTPPPTKQPREETFRVPAPVIFYGQELDPNKKPGAPKAPAPIAQAVDHVPLPLPQEPLKTLPANSFIASSADNTPAQATEKSPSLADIFNHARSTFSSPHVEELQEGEGSGQPVVIREGDMKYYSLWATFLKHLNDTARFNRIRKPVPLDEWIRTKKVTHNLQCGITVNKKGEVLDITIVTSSGYKPFDQLCIQDIWAASPFPPLPDQLKKETARFEVKSYL